MKKSEKNRIAIVPRFISGNPCFSLLSHSLKEKSFRVCRWNPNEDECSTSDQSIQISNLPSLRALQARITKNEAQIQAKSE